MHVTYLSIPVRQTAVLFDEEVAVSVEDVLHIRSSASEKQSFGSSTSMYEDQRKKRTRRVHCIQSGQDAP